MKNYIIKSERIKKLRENILNKTPSVCIERAKYFTQSYKENEDKPIYIKRAKALEKTLENMSIYIKDGELIVGNQSCNERTAPIFPEYAVQWIEDELKEKGNFNKREGDNFYLEENKIDELLEIIQYWKGKTLKDKCYAIMPKEIEDAINVKIIHGEGNMTSGDGHIIPDFEKALKLGLNGIIKEAEHALKNIDICENNSFKKIAFLESTIIVNKSIINFALRYSKLAKKLASNTKDSIRKNELLLISNICETVPKNPPKTFMKLFKWFGLYI